MTRNDLILSILRIDNFVVKLFTLLFSKNLLVKFFWFVLSCLSFHFSFTVSKGVWASLHGTRQLRRKRCAEQAPIHVIRRSPKHEAASFYGTTGHNASGISCFFQCVNALVCPTLWTSPASHILHSVTDYTSVTIECMCVHTKSRTMGGGTLICCVSKKTVTHCFHCIFDFKMHDALPPVKQTTFHNVWPKIIRELIKPGFFGGKTPIRGLSGAARLLCCRCCFSSFSSG